jgi:hypothetical protein
VRRQHFEPAGIFPIQIRPDLVVRIHPMPHDLTQAEADRICRVVQAMVLPAQAIEARRAETGTGSVEDESAVPQGCALTPSNPSPKDYNNAD